MLQQSQYNTLFGNNCALIEKTLEKYKSNLPLKPYYTDDYFYGKKIAGHNVALKSRHIQPNSKTHIYYMLFDVDRQTASFDWNDRNLPSPHLVVINPDNGHAHLTYMLETSIKNDVTGRKKPYNYFSDVELGLAIKLGADLAYNATLTKNPFNKGWRTLSFECEPYDLGYLNDFVDTDMVAAHKISKKQKEKAAGYSTSRNCMLFEALRIWAYKNFMHDSFYSNLENHAQLLNSFEAPLGSNEVNTIVRSVYDFVNKNFSLERLAELKSERARQSGLKGGGRPVIHVDKPWELEGVPASTYYYRKSNPTAESAESMKPWEAMNMSRRTYYRKKKEGII